MFRFKKKEIITVTIPTAESLSERYEITYKTYQIDEILKEIQQVAKTARRKRFRNAYISKSAYKVLLKAHYDVFIYTEKGMDPWFVVKW